VGLLEVRDLTKRFAGLVAVNGCTFSVEEGKITALIGPNGAGKSTTFDLICGLQRPDRGSVILDGKNITGHRPHRVTRRGVGRTFQLTRDLTEMNVLENLIVQSPLRGPLDLLKRSVLKGEEERAMELLRFVGIEHLSQEKAKKLSFGQKKLMELAAVLMVEPRLIMLDEPAGGVNPALLDDITARIEQLNADGKTFLIVEHNMDFVMQLSHSVIVMAHGEILVQDTADAVRMDETVLDAYLGTA
jgi:neutral amino acid transport system ATP-binding protein